ncbi:hypothetical protein F4809DRAFT_645257 [Biscogniauxia mediterranea]|nr:hypothetical protein F4809DRAFT_645257 [Biscogniauxia mediterranea]
MGGSEDDKPAADAAAGCEKHQYQHHEEGDTHFPSPSPFHHHHHHHHNNNSNNNNYYPSTYPPLSSHYRRPPQTSSGHHHSLPSLHTPPPPSSPTHSLPSHLSRLTAQGPYPTSRYHRRYYGNHCSPRHHHHHHHDGGPVVGHRERLVDHSATHAHSSHVVAAGGAAHVHVHVHG